MRPCSNEYWCARCRPATRLGRKLPRFRGNRGRPRPFPSLCVECRGTLVERSPQAEEIVQEALGLARPERARHRRQVRMVCGGGPAEEVLAALGQPDDGAAAIRVMYGPGAELALLERVDHRGDRPAYRVDDRAELGGRDAAFTIRVEYREVVVLRRGQAERCKPGGDGVVDAPAEGADRKKELDAQGIVRAREIARHTLDLPGRDQNLLVAVHFPSFAGSMERRLDESSNSRYKGPMRLSDRGLSGGKDAAPARP